MAMNYYVNTRAQANGEHEVHRDGCRWMPSEENTQHLGAFGACHDAVAMAKRTYRKANGCSYCSPACHTG